MTHAMVKGSNIPLKASGVRAVLRWSPGSRRAGCRRVGAAARPGRTGPLGRGLRLLQPAQAPVRCGPPSAEAERHGRPHRQRRGGSVRARPERGPGGDLRLRRRQPLRPGLGPAADALRRRRRGPGLLRRRAGHRQRVGADLRGAVPAGRRVEVPRPRPGVCERAGRPCHRVRHLRGRGRHGGSRLPTPSRPPCPSRCRPWRSPSPTAIRWPRRPWRPPSPPPSPCGPAYGYPPAAAPTVPAAAYGYPQQAPATVPAPAYGYPHQQLASPTAFKLPPQGPQFQERR